MKIDHFIIGSQDVKKSTSFYCELFGFEKVSDDPGAEGGQVLQSDGCDLLILPFKIEKLPNPVHFAFEAKSIIEFDMLLNKALAMGLEPRSEPSKNSTRGFGIFKRGQSTFKNFYLSDPSNTNVEVLVYI